MRYLFLLLLALVVPAQADSIFVQHDGTTAFCATGLGSISNGTWNFTGTCTTPPPPSGRILSSRIAYVPNTGQLRQTGVTEWTQVFGHATAIDAEVAFPGRPNSQPSVMDFRRTGYLALHFVPGSIGRFGMVQHTEYNYGADLTWAISTVAGDFSPANALCHGATLSGQQIARWTTQPTTYRSYCPVIVGGNYYLNVKLTDPTQGTSTCGMNQVACVIGFANSFGG